MNKIAEKLIYLNNIKQAIKAAILDKGVDISDEDPFMTYAEKIKDIKGGSSSYIIADDDYFYKIKSFDDVTDMEYTIVYQVEVVE